MPPTSLRATGTEESGKLKSTMSFFNTVASSNLTQITRSLLDSSSEEEGEEKRSGGSRPGRAANVDRHGVLLGDILYRQYFAEVPTYDEATFRRRFRVSRRIFDRIFDDVVESDPYFQQKRDCTGKLGLSPYQKITASLRMLVYGVSADSIDDKIGIAESTTLQSMERFCDAIKTCFGREYMRAPSDEDMKRIMIQSAARGFPGMLGSIDCSKWKWSNCPTAWQGEYRGKEKTSAVTLEAIADQSLWIWHAFFGMPGCLNDINVVEASPLLDKIANGEYPPPCEYKINGVRRNKPYWLTDGIYPDWPVFIDSIMNPSTKKQKFFAAMQEATRKDIERAFGVLQSMWHIITVPSRFESITMMQKVMTCVVILHNMVVEERGHAAVEDGDAFAEDVKVRAGAAPMWEGMVAVSTSKESVTPGSLAARCVVQEFTTRTQEKELTKRLLVNHLWEQHGDM